MIAPTAVTAMLVSFSLISMTREASAADEPDRKPEVTKGRFFEMRTATAPEGKLDALHARFRDHTNALFQKHGMTIIGFWTPADAPRQEHADLHPRLSGPGIAREELEGISGGPRLAEGEGRFGKGRKAHRKNRVGLPDPDRFFADQMRRPSRGRCRCRCQ